MMELSFALNCLNNNDFKGLVSISENIKRLSEQLQEAPLDMFGEVIEN